MKKIVTLLFLSFAFFSAMSQTGTNVVISQVYGAGGNASANFNADFVELFNPTANPINITGFSVQYAAATGTTWQKADIPTFTLNAGKYYLVQMSAVGATGSALPTPDATASPAIAMSGTAGKVALVNNGTLLSGSQCPTFSASIIDYVGFGSTANCYEGSGPTPNPGTNAQSLTRINAGCTDANNNAADFVSITTAPRNSGSPVNLCGGGSSPTIIASPNISGLTTNVGTASAQQSYNLSASNLTPAAGNITVTPSAGLEVSTTSGSGFSSAPITVAYTAGTLATTPVYVRISSAAPQGAVNGTVDNSGGGATTSTVTVTGSVFQNYYNTKANLGLNNAGTWSTTPDGLGASPANFSNPYQLFNITNQPNATYSGVWDVSNAGNTVRVVVGDGFAPVTFNILTGADSLTSATRVDVMNNSTLRILNNKRPFLNNLSTGSTVDYAQTGTTTADTIRPAAISYYNLKLTNGIKMLASNTTTVRGNFTIDAVTNFNGNTGVFSTLNLFGDMNLTNGSTFEPLPSGDGARITLALNGSAGSQSINGNGADLRLFRLQRDTITSSEDIFVGSNTNLVLGNNSGGGLRLNQGASTNTSLVTGSNNLSFIGAAASTATALGKLDCNGGIITVAKSAVAGNAGTLRFTVGSNISQLVVNFDATQARDSITIADDILLNSGLTLTKGKVVVTGPASLMLGAAAAITGGSTASFVDGKLKRNTAAASAFVFPTGKGAAAYRPVTVTPGAATASSYTAEYFAAAYSSLGVTGPLTAVSNTEYWDVAKNSGADASISLSLNGTAVNTATATDEVVVAHYESGSWVSVNGTSITPGNSTTGTAVSSVLSTFSPFTFGVKPAAAGVTYTFNGNGNWDVASNWSNNTIPPATLNGPDQIVIDPAGTGECVLNINQTINTGGSFTVATGKKFRIIGNLIRQ